MPQIRTEGSSAASETPTACWQSGFVAMLPLIERHARYYFRTLHDDESLQEAIQEVICNACVAYARLHQQGRVEVASATSLARYGVAQYWEGCRVGNSLNIKDVCSVRCQRRKGVRVRPLCRWDDAKFQWQEILVEDRTASPADLAASRIDFADFMKSLGKRTRKIAELLAVGETTNRVAEIIGVTAGRISQIRRELQAKWEAMHEPQVAVA